MVDADVIPMLTQFGVAGLIGWMWLAERRSAGQRERELSQAHDRVMAQRLELESLVQVVRDNTRAMSALEAAQRELVGTVRLGLAARPRVAHGEARAIHSHDDAA
jgi:nitrate reductase gamma subunit